MGEDYTPPKSKNAFQRAMYAHLVHWKHQHITTELGPEGQISLPKRLRLEANSPLIFPPVREALAAHRIKNPFRLHPHFYHMASSQAAAINLFLPLVLDEAGAAVLRAVKPDLVSIEHAQLDRGYCVEYWGGNFDGAGEVFVSPLGDKTAMSGTDSDFAIAYRNADDELCLWLIEHKLTEAEFTKCKGATSKGRLAHHDCQRDLGQLMNDASSCYLHDVRKFKYWELTKLANQSFRVRNGNCPFNGGAYQLWRNQLMAIAIEQDPRFAFSHAHFSVVRHPQNRALDETLADYSDLITPSTAFSVFDSDALVHSAEAAGSPTLSAWAQWYRGLYNLPAG